MTALGREGAITVTHTGVELADCVAWIPTATLDGNEGGAELRDRR
jgi:hypothetical protein